MFDLDSEKPKHDENGFSQQSFQIIGQIAGLSGAEIASLHLVSHLSDPNGKSEMHLEVTGENLKAAEAARKKLEVAMETILTPQVLQELGYLRGKIDERKIRIKTAEAAQPR